SSFFSSLGGAGGGVAGLASGLGGAVTVGTRAVVVRIGARSSAGLAGSGFFLLQRNGLGDRPGGGRRVRAEMRGELGDFVGGAPGLSKFFDEVGGPELAAADEQEDAVQ